MADPLAIKLVVAPPGDTDPPSSPISITDNIIGINPPFAIGKNLSTPYDFDAVGDGVTDDTAAMQAWLDAIAGSAGFGAAGTFPVSASLAVASGTTIWGAGPTTFVIVKAPGFSPFAPLIANANPGVTPGTFTDSALAFQSCGFDGGNETAFVELIGLTGVDGVSLRDCKLQHFRYIGLALRNSRNVLVDGCEFDDWGDTGITLDGGAALYTDDSVSTVRIARNYFHDGEWSAIYLSCLRSTVTGNHIASCKEAAIFGNPQFAVIANNVIEHVTMKYFTAFGMSFGGSNLVINANFISDTGNDSIHLLNVTDSTVSNNVCRLAGQTTAYFSACIGLLSGLPPYAFGPEMRNVTISGNILSNDAGTTQHGVELNLVGGDPSSPYAGPPMEDLMICNNNLSALAWPQGDVTIGSGAIGKRFCRKDNIDTLDRAPVVFSLTVNPGDVLVPVVCGYAPSWVEFKAVVDSTGGASVSIGQCAPTMSALFPLTGDGSTSISWATDGTNAGGAASEQFCINVLDATASPICAAHIASFDAQGFTLAVDSCSAATRVFATCHR